VTTVGLGARLRLCGERPSQALLFRVLLLVAEAEHSVTLFMSGVACCRRVSPPSPIRPGQEAVLPSQLFGWPGDFGLLFGFGCRSRCSCWVCMAWRLCQHSLICQDSLWPVMPTQPKACITWQNRLCVACMAKSPGDHAHTAPRRAVGCGAGLRTGD
jgi:hypothetical protein